MTTTQPSKAWMVTFAALGVNLVLGLLYTWGVFQKALVDQWGWSSTAASLPYSIAIGVFAFTMIFAGRAQDKYGPRYIAMFGGIMLGAGLILSGLTSNTMVMTITFGVVGACGIGFGYSVTTPCAIKWFEPQKRGLISGIVVAGVGLAPVYIAPLTNALIKSWGIQHTFIILGVFAIVAITLFSLILKNPQQHASPVQKVKDGPAASVAEVPWSVILKSKEFYRLWFMYLLSAMAGLMLIGHLPKIASSQANWKAGYILVVILSLFNAAGRVIIGSLSDKIGRKTAMVIVFVLQAANMFIFTFYTSIPLLIVGAALAGLAYGALFTLFPATTADLFGVKNLGVNTLVKCARALGASVSIRMAPSRRSSATAGSRLRRAG
jgi:OFA family oxalate/formate antiporter-like MFS transporter